MPVEPCDRVLRAVPEIPLSLIGQTDVKSQRLRDWRPLAILFVGVLCRAIYYVTFKPWWCGDSNGYTASFFLWSHGYFSDGGRTPIYPLFWGLAQWLAGVPATTGWVYIQAVETVRDLQCALGLLAACLLYYTLRALRVRKSVAFVAGLFFSTTTLVCNVEMAVVTPSLSLFSLVLGIWLYVRMMVKINKGENALKLAIIVGFSIAFAGLLRPDNLVFFAVIVLATAAFAIRSTFIPARAALARRLLVACFLVPLSASPFVLVSMTCNYISTGRFRITNIMGWQATQSVYNMFDQVDPEDRLLGNIMTKHYLAANRHGINRQYIWLAADEIRARSWEMPILSDTVDHNRSKLSNWVYHLASDQSKRFSDPISVAIGDYLTRVSWKLIKKNPFGYLRNAADSFVRDSFDFTVMLPSPEEITDPRAVEGGSVVKSRAGWEVVRWAGKAQAPFLTVFYLVALAYVLCCPLVLFSGGNDTTTSDVAVTALAMGTVGTFLAFCLVEAYHPQYGVPHVGVLLVCTAYAVNNFKRIIETVNAGRNFRP